MVIKQLGLSGRAFEKECGLANGSFSSIGNGVGADKLNKILVRYPQISADWLLTGKGDMIREVKKQPPNNDDSRPNEPIATPEIPIADADAETAAGEFPSAGYCNGEGVNVRAEGNADAEIVDVLGENTAIQVMALENEWYQIELNGQTAYISAPLVTLGEAPRGDNTRYAKVTGRDVQTYGTPAEDDVRETKLERNSVVKVLRSMNGYAHVVYNKSLQCYIKEDSVEFITKEEYDSALAG